MKSFVVSILIREESEDGCQANPDNAQPQFPIRERNTKGVTLPSFIFIRRV